ncbi:AAA family ATPase [Staphylococcus simiae]|uniref:ATP-dependent nuclease n=1 Tax=Staphylococcus simiae TaxID=308354 RepID=UPI001A96DFF3|nr:AAA family ATPase [Staphylococcus simiae]MBO1198389.1 AAA family ATPase [Staphylococcus simiae]MBO1200583.1 AAA family ATPase [Staphylococcus simiae]MBO1202854.1 AAA family ATPase [Staphylococcus simiae]MBO1210381.1 AAA family ATPase [Staphylococcus simiae]MBO1228920.1 AAA family ATPase [Staphylococcus simiae]
MDIEWIKIKGFRNFIEEKINFSQKSLIIGANDIGKTNLIFALRLLFDRSLSDRDLDLFDSDYNVYTQAENIEITVKITNVCEDCLLATFKGDINDGTVFIKYENSKKGEYNILAGPSEELLESKSSRFYIKRLNMEYVNTNRNLDSFMKREKNQIIEDAKSQLTEEQDKQDEESINNIKKDLNNMNRKIDGLNYIRESLDKVNTELELLAIHNVGQKLTFKNANSDVDKLLSNIELNYNTDEGALTLGGDGRNNQIFLATWVSKQKSIKSLEKVTFYAIEEPEAHLHPQQQRKLSSYLLDKFDEQIFITTHSPHIASEFRPNNIVKLYTRNKSTKVAKGGCSKELQWEFDDFGYRLDAITSDVFFVNAVFLVEGPSEKLFYTALAKKLNIDLDKLNVSIITVNGIGFKPYIKICLALDIPFVLRTDNDIFNKTKKNENITISYHAGISRVMGIYREFLLKDNNEELLKFWEENNHKNEWDKSNNRPQDAIDFAEEIKEKLEDFNIYLSQTDLEYDLVHSGLFDSLKHFYDTDNEKDTVDKMQEAKAENMFNFLKNDFDELVCLMEDKISNPLKRIAHLAEEVVNGNE